MIHISAHAPPPPKKKKKNIYICVGFTYLCIFIEYQLHALAPAPPPPKKKGSTKQNVKLMATPIRHAPFLKIVNNAHCSPPASALFKAARGTEPEDSITPELRGPGRMLASYAAMASVQANSSRMDYECDYVNNAIIVKIALVSLVSTQKMLLISLHTVRAIV